MRTMLLAPAVPARRWPAPVFLALLLTTLSCGKEKPAAPGEKGQPPAPQPTETASPERRPTVLSKAEPDRPPFSGLHGPRDAAVDEKGRLWVMDFGNSTVQIFDGAGGSLGGWGSRGIGNYGLKDPCGIAVRGDDVYVADTWNGRIEQFSASGEWKARSPGDFYGPRGVAVSADGKVWVADTGNHRVVAFEKNLSSPRYFGKSGTGPGEFSSPIGIAIGPGGSVYVADTGNKRIQILDSEGNFKSQWKVSAWGENSEAYLEVDGDGTVYMTDPPANAVVEIGKNGNEARRWTADDGGKKFARPTGIALDPKNRILYIVNTDSSAISTIKLPRRQ